MVIPKQFSLFFLKKELVAHETYSFHFDLSRTNLDFFPGQYVRITLPFQANDGRGTSRFLTVSSSPLVKEKLIITTKSGPSDFKKALFALEPQQKVDFFGPMGGFYFRETIMQKHVFLAGGIGITPFWSMIQYIAAKQLTMPVTLIVSFSTPSDILYMNELNQISHRQSNIQIIHTITSPKALWKGERGRISEKLIRKYIPNISEPLYFIVGSLKMVTDTEDLLVNMGIPQQQIRLEQFTGY